MNIDTSLQTNFYLNFTSSFTFVLFQSQDQTLHLVPTPPLASLICEFVSLLFHELGFWKSCIYRMSETGFI